MVAKTARVAPLLLAAFACGGSPTANGYRIVLPSSQSHNVHPGDTVTLAIGQTFSDGTLASLPGAAVVTWSSNVTQITAVPQASATSSTPNPIPPFGAEVTAIMIANPARTDRQNDLSNQVFILDAGTAASPQITIVATISGITPAGTASVTLNVGGALVGNATNGALVYGMAGANCASCHGATGHGSPANPDGTYTYNNKTYTYPAQGLNAETGHLAADPKWSAALLAMASRADIDNGGIELRAPMLDYLVEKTSTTGLPPSAQDFADVYAFLKTQTQ